MAHSIKSYLALPKPDMVWLWRNLVPQSGSVLLYADPKTGKSKLALSLAEAIADPSITEYLGLPIDTHGRVLYVQLDTPRNLWIANYVSCIRPGPAHDGVFMLDREMAEVPFPFNIRLPPCRDYIRREVDEIQPVAVIVDVIRKTYPGNENDSDIAEHVLGSWWEATKPAANIYLAHKRKPQMGDMPDGLVGARGSTGFTGAVDMLLDMTKTKLTMLGRSELDEPIPIIQQDDGTFRVNNKDDEIRNYLIQMAGEGKSPGAVNESLMKRFGVTERTARRYRRMVEGR